MSTSHQMTGVQLLTGGSQEKIELPPEYVVGQRATMDMDMNVDLAADFDGQSEDVGVGLTMTLTSEVTEATEAGSTVEMTVDAIDGRIFGRGEDEILAEMEPLIGKALVVEYDENGNVEYDENGNQVGTTTLKDGSDLPESLADSFETATATAFPNEAIGIGSRWSSVTTSNSVGFELEITTVYELTDITEDELIIAVTQDLPVDEEVDGSQLSGTLKGSGELRLARDNPLVLDMQYDQQADFSFDQDGNSGEVDVTINMAVDAR
ncbi:hypothetical protein BH18ACT3_BH18ACT3_29290 [soil metagenome]